MKQTSTAERLDNFLRLEGATVRDDNDGAAAAARARASDRERDARGENEEIRVRPGGRGCSYPPPEILCSGRRRASRGGIELGARGDDTQEEDDGGCRWAGLNVCCCCWTAKCTRAFLLFLFCDLIQSLFSI